MSRLPHVGGGARTAEVREVASPGRHRAARARSCL